MCKCKKFVHSKILVFQTSIRSFLLGKLLFPRFITNFFSDKYKNFSSKYLIFFHLENWLFFWLSIRNVFIHWKKFLTKKFLCFIHLDESVICYCCLTYIAILTGILSAFYIKALFISASSHFFESEWGHNRRKAFLPIANKVNTALISNTV